MDKEKDEVIFDDNQPINQKDDNIDNDVNLSHQENFIDQTNQKDKVKDDVEILKEKSLKYLNIASVNFFSLLKDKYNLAFLVILLLSFLIRLKYFGMESIWNDAAVHLWYSIRVVSEPLFLFNSEYILGDYFIVQTLTAIVYLFTKNVFFAGKIVAIFFGMIGVIFIYLLGTELKNKTTGLISAALLGFNHLFWFYGIRPLADAPLTTMVILILYCVVKLEKENNLKWSILTGIIFISAIFVKKQAILFILALTIYYLIFKKKKLFTNKFLLISWLIPFGFVILAEIFGRLFLGAKEGFLSSVLSILISARGMAAGFEVTKHFVWIFSWYLLIFIIIGFLLVLLYKKKEYYFGIVLFITYWIYFEIGIGPAEDRYVLYILPIGISLAAFALDEIKSYLSFFNKKKIVNFGIIIIIVGLLCWNYYNIGDPLIYNKSFSYGGFYEAGDWIKENIPDNAIIFTGSPRMLRIFAEISYGGKYCFDDGCRGIGESGNLWSLRGDEYSQNKSLFEKDLIEISKQNEVYLEIDMWEYTQPSWYYPISQKSIDYFTSLGFEIVNVIERDLETPDGTQTVPVIFIFKYNN